MTKQELSELYDKLYESADRLFKKYNPCGIEAGICLSVRMDHGETARYGHHRDTLCCTGCEYHTSSGCTVKAIYCKLWICDRVRKYGDPIFVVKIDRLWKRSRPLRQYSAEQSVRISKEDYMKGVRVNRNGQLFIWWSYVCCNI